ncbi:hypothetical protein LWI29_035433 [Acer saccharum]|uniref:NIF system FeS cluster assembly NifU C-terminal domain-containing protein n=1 Tax=Acer saccharum TaxID=4024 RepID=A0AA39VEU6_ACESA|nr:hypothetical protein LWI29_035433 [Acer saccharum]
MGNGSFPVKLVEQAEQPSSQWLSEHLGLRPMGSNLNCNTEELAVEQVLSKSTREACPWTDHRSDKGRKGEKEDDFFYSRFRKENRKNVREEFSSNPKYLEKEKGGPSEVRDKGEDCWIPIARSKARVEYRSGSSQEKRMFGPGPASFSSDTDSGPLLQGKWTKGECSTKRIEERQEVNKSGGGLYDSGLKGENRDEPDQNGFNEHLAQVESSNGDTSDSSSSDSDDNSQKSKSDHNPSSIQVVPETQLEARRGIDLMVDLREEGDERSIQGIVQEGTVMDDSTGQDKTRECTEQENSRKPRGKNAKKPRGKCSNSAFKIHPMVTRGGNTVIGHKEKTKRVVWNLEEEISKIIEKGVARRLERASKRRGVDGDASGGQNLEGEEQERGNSGNTEEEAVATPDSAVELPLTAKNVENVMDEVRPYLIADGGNVALHEIDGNIVRLKLQGVRSRVSKCVYLLFLPLLVFVEYVKD